MSTSTTTYWLHPWDDPFGRSPHAKDAAQAEAEFFRMHRSSSLLQRLIDPAEIAHLVAYLASPLSAATNGATL